MGNRNHRLHDTATPEESLAECFENEWVYLHYENEASSNVILEDESPECMLITPEDTCNKVSSTTINPQPQVPSQESTDECADVDFIESLQKKNFDKLIKFMVDGSGTVYHCNRYGVTLVIPKEAVSQPTTVWYGARLLCDKFQFQGDYVPVSPIVWVHTSHELIKPAELYIPHHVDITDMENPQQKMFLMTKEDDFATSASLIKPNKFFKIAETQVEITALHFCSFCLLTKTADYSTLTKRYFIARADKKEPNGEHLVDFAVIFQSPGCKKMIEEKWANDNFKINPEFKSFEFAQEKEIIPKFEPDKINGWKRQHNTFITPSIKEESVEYHNMTIDQLKLQEDTLNYPPRFRYRFIPGPDGAVDESITVEFMGTKNLTKVEINLHKPLMTGLLIYCLPSAVNSISKKSDPILGHIFDALLNSNALQDKWFTFGYQLTLEIGLLRSIENNCSDPARRVMEVLLHWRHNNPTDSWESIETALQDIKLFGLASEIRSRFIAPSEPEEVLHNDDIPPATNLSETLDITSLNAVIEKLAVIRFPNAKWHPLGLSLGLYENTLIDINAKHSSDPTACLWGVLVCWFNKQDNATCELNWLSLKNAISSKTVNEIAAAEKLL